MKQANSLRTESAWKDLRAHALATGNSSVTKALEVERRNWKTSKQSRNGKRLEGFAGACPGDRKFFRDKGA